MVSETISFSTERNSMSAIGMMKLMATKMNRGATRASANMRCRRSALARETFSGWPSAVTIASAALFCMSVAVILVR